MFMVMLTAIALVSFIAGFGQELSFTSIPKQKLCWGVEEVVLEGVRDKTHTDKQLNIIYPFSYACLLVPLTFSHLEMPHVTLIMYQGLF